MTTTLQLVVNDSLKLDHESKEFLSYIHQIMVFFKRSTAWSDELKALTKVDIVLPAKTRWNAVLDMLQRFQKEEFFSAVKTVLKKANAQFRPSKESTIHKKKPPPRNLVRVVDMKKGKHLYQILLPVGIATDELQSDGPTFNLIVSSIAMAFQRLHTLKVEYFDGLRVKILENLKSRMEGVLNKLQVIVAAVLDPRTKLGLFEIPWETKNGLRVPSHRKALETITALYDIEKAVAEHQTIVQETGISVARPKSPVQENRDDIFSLMATSTDSEATDIKTELDNYLLEQRADKSVDILDYWRVHAKKFPIVAELARKYLSIPASSGGMERVFSITGAIARSRRAKIYVKNLCNILLVRQDRKGSLRDRAELKP